jgi:chromosome segregation ATPase
LCLLEANYVAAPLSSHTAFSRIISPYVARQGSISSLETQNVSYARLLATTQKSLEERNVAYAALAPRNRELTQRCTEQQQELEDARAECARLQAQLTEAVNAKEQAESALKNKEDEAEELSKQLTMAEEAGEGGLATDWSADHALCVHWSGK